MNFRPTVLILTALVTLGVAVPAIGETTTTVPPKVKSGSAERALAKARLALLTARSAKSQSRVAVRTANAAVNTANEAKGTATATQAALEATKIQSGLAPNGATTESEAFVQLPGGPSVTVTVPASGLIEVWAQATMSEPGAVSLYEDGQQMAGQAQNCGPEEIGGVLFAGFPFGPVGATTAGTPAAAGVCGTEGAPGSVLFQTTPGTHTYELRYSVGCSCAPEVTFSKRSLRVAPRL